MKKGVILPVGGILLIIFSVVFVAILGFGGSTMTRSLTFRGELAFSVLDETEGLRKMLPVGTQWIAQKQAGDLCRNGDGYAVWEITNPTLYDLLTDLNDSIEYGLPRGVVPTADIERTIDFDRPSIGANFIGTQTGDYISSDKFRVSGTANFSVLDSRIGATVESSAPIDVIVNSSYFRLASLAVKLVNNETYIITKSRIGNPSSIAAGSSYDINTTTVLVQPGCTITANSAGYCDATNCYVPVSNMLGTAYKCGFGNVDGVPVVGTATGVSNKIKELLQSTPQYSGLSIVLTPTDPCTSYCSVVVNITDPNNFVPLKPEEMSLSIGGNVPFSTLQMIFKTGLQY